MARLQRAVLVLAFLAVCGGMMVFLLQFTESAPSFDYPLWEEGAVVAADGTETSFDPNGAVPSLADGDRYRFSMTLPDERAAGQWLIFDAAGLETTVSLAGTTLWQSSAVQDGATMNLSQVQLALPAGGGEELTMMVRPLSETVVMPPFPRLSYEPTDQAGAIAYANHYGIPAGISALALVLLWGLFLLEWAQGRKNWRLLLPMFAGAALTVHQLAIGFGGYFLSDRLVAVCSGRWLTVLAPLALVLFLALHREGRFWRALGWVTLWSLVALGLATAISYWRGGYLAMYLHNQLEALATHYYDGLLYWFTLWLVLVCTLLAAWAFVRTTAQTQAEAQAMALKNALMRNNIQALETRVRGHAGAQHETAHRLAAMDAMLRKGDFDGLAKTLAAWKKDSQHASQPRFTDNLTLDAIFQDAAARAASAEIPFQATVSVPKTLPLSDEDLCVLLMNMLDNAITAASQTPSDQERRLRVQVRCTGGFLAIHCENSFSGRLARDAQGRLCSTKDDGLGHGFGLKEMQHIAEKYGSILDIQTSENRFIVQTALKLPKET